MSWCGLIGHDEQVDRFRRGLRSGRLASTFLLCGPSGIGKRLFALRVAQGLLCERRPDVDLNPCLECPSCVQIEAGTHPDVEVVEKPEDKSFIPIDLLVGDMDHRMREGLCHRISLKPVRGQRRVAIIDDADYLNEAGSNALLKTLEEPPPGAILFLISTSPQRQLPTIRSRSQIYHFRPLPDDFVRQFVMEREWATSASHAEQLVELAEGSLDRAREFSDPEIDEFRRELLDMWNQHPRASWGLTKLVDTFVDAVGKDTRQASVRRSRLRIAMQLMIHHFRRSLTEHARGAAEAASEAGVEATCARVDRCLHALNQLDANANLATLSACWIDDLCQEPPYAWSEV